MPVLTAIDVLGIQSYVFASNRLRDAVGASWVVHSATSKRDGLLSWEGQVLVGSGGNAVLQFRDLDQARAFAGEYTYRLFREAPGIQVAVVHRPYSAGELAR